MQQGQLTEKERLTVQELLSTEDICSKKVQLYMNQTQDSNVHKTLQQMADKSRHHINTLNSILQQESGGTVGYNSMQ